MADPAQDLAKRYIVVRYLGRFIPAIRWSGIPRLWTIVPAMLIVRVSLLLFLRKEEGKEVVLNLKFVEMLGLFSALKLGKCRAAFLTFSSVNNRRLSPLVISGAVAANVRSGRREKSF